MISEANIEGKERGKCCNNIIIQKTENLTYLRSRQFDKLKHQAHL